jgi:DinB family protein
VTDEAAIPARLAPFLAQWDYIVEVLTDRLAGLADEEFLWKPASTAWTVRPDPAGGRNLVDAEVWSPTGDPAPPRTIAWSLGHLGSGVAIRADWLIGAHKAEPKDFEWPLTAAAGVRFMFDGLAAWRNGIATMSDQDLDTVGRSASPYGLDRELPLLDIVWWVSKELAWHAAEIWYVRDLYAGTRGSSGVSPGGVPS